MLINVRILIDIRLLELSKVVYIVLFLLVVLTVRVDSHLLIGSGFIFPQVLFIFPLFFNNIYELLSKD